LFGFDRVKVKMVVRGIYIIRATEPTAQNLKYTLFAQTRWELLLIKKYQNNVSTAKDVKSKYLSVAGRIDLQDQQR
jgi:hypothetical protein